MFGWCWDYVIFFGEVCFGIGKDGNFVILMRWEFDVCSRSCKNRGSVEGKESKDGFDGNYFVGLILKIVIFVFFGWSVEVIGRVERKLLSVMVEFEKIVIR